MKTDLKRGATTLKQTIEAALLGSPDPLSIHDLKRMFDEEVTSREIKLALSEITEDWSDRSA